MCGCEERAGLIRIRDARELVAELEFVWDQIKNNSASSSSSSPAHRVPSYSTQPRMFKPAQSGDDGPMRVLSPMSQDDEADRDSRLLEDNDDNDMIERGEKKEAEKGTKRWRKTVEQALVKMTAEVAALREQITTGREYQGRKSRTVGRWLAWFIWVTIKHFVVDLVVLLFILVWLRKRKDRRVEDLVREGLKIGREYARKFLPSR